MQTNWMGRPLGLPAVSPITIAKAAVKLNKGCYEKGGRFHSVLKWKGNNINLGAFETAEECNNVWDRSKERRKIKARIPAAQGYTPATCGDTYKVNLMVGGVYKYIGTYKTKSLARATYLKAHAEETQRLLDELK